MDEFWLCFVPLFVAVNAVGVLPIFMGLTESLERPAVRPLIAKSMITAMSVATMFIFFGLQLLAAMGLAPGHFMIAGGIMLFLTAIVDLVPGGARRRDVSPDDVGVVPIGVPLISGPAVLTTAIIQSQIYGVWMTLLAMFLNVLIAGAVFWSSGALYRFLGHTGSLIVSKISHLLLASVAVKLVLKGILLIVAPQ
ncbi:MAG: MarC family protein [Desulfovibrionaceae bacterium]|nr:MarC family protein [Desulfovibrionaceae bacterium]MBF0513691.1 MarC family protein [Desulfovibrionaceae bacterium]